MPAAAPRIDQRLVAAVARIDDGKLPVAELNRRLGAVALHLGLPRPSYEQVRVLVRAVRRRQLDPATGEVLLDIAFRTRPPDALLEHVSGVGVPRLPK